jgi:hypothetical protein
MSELFNIFLFRCIPARILLSGSIIATSAQYMNYWIIPAIITIIYIFSRILNYNELNKKKIKQKGFFGQEYNYNYTRFFHILMIFTFIILTMSKKYVCAKTIPLIDLLSGIIFVLHNYNYI